MSTMEETASPVPAPAGPVRDAHGEEARETAQAERQMFLALAAVIAVELCALAWALGAWGTAAPAGRQQVVRACASAAHCAGR
jgi:hypothetical protein